MEAGVGDFEGDDLVAGGAGAVLGDMQGTADFAAVVDFAQVNDGVGIGQHVAFIKWAADELFEHGFGRRVEEQAADLAVIVMVL